MNLLDPRISGIISNYYTQEFANIYPDYACFTPWMPLAGPWNHPIRNGTEPTPSFPVEVFLGVYIVGRFQGCPPPQGPADAFCDNVLYVGRTRGNTLRGRWGQLARTLKGTGEHSGGGTIYRQFIQGQPDPDTLRSQFYIAGLPVYRSNGNGREDIHLGACRTGLIEAALIDAINSHRAAMNPRQPFLLNAP